MSNNTVPAVAAEGLPQIDRRRLLLGLAAASTAAATVAVAQAAPAPVFENPELIALSQEFKAAVAKKAAAVHAKEWLIDEWRHRWPLAPDEITLPGVSKWDSDGEVDLAGRPIIRPGEAHARRLRSLDKLTSLAESMAAFLEKARNEKDRERKLAALARDKRNLCLGEEYYREIERIKDASGIRAADARIGAAKGEICRLGESIMAIPPSSVACLTMKAEAVEVWFETMFPGLKEETSFVAWPIHMARDIRNVVLGGVS